MNHWLVLLILAWFVFLFNIERFDIDEQPLINISNPTYALAVIIGLSGVVFPGFANHRFWQALALVIGSYWVVIIIIENGELFRSTHLYLLELLALFITLVLMRQFSSVLSDYELLLEKLVLDEKTSRILNFQKASLKIDQEIHRALHYHRPLSLIYCRVHRTGTPDKPTTGELRGLQGIPLERRYQLVKLANAISLLSYETDILCIYGDGIVVCLPETDATMAESFVAQVNQLLQLSMQFTIIIAGVAQLPEHGKTLEELLTTARGKVQVRLQRDDTPPPITRQGDVFVDLDKRLEIEKESDWVNRVPFQSADALALYRPIKRAMDVTAVLLLIPFLLPLWIIIATLIVLDSGFPVFYMQPRTGYDGRRFLMYKFRSMTAGAPADSAKEIRLPDGTVRYEWAEKKPEDQRITRVGRFIRKASIDELPQLINILLGDMSLVGPRPTTWDLDKYTMVQTERLTERPGLTGLWQVCARETTNFDERLLWDIKYVARMSFWLDIQILIRTVLQVVNRKGA
jgi:lipopolysaccharide/colanic/teichoic acid biosynthesis glycosyltransferase